MVKLNNKTYQNMLLDLVLLYNLTILNDQNDQLILI